MSRLATPAPSAVRGLAFLVVPDPYQALPLSRAAPRNIGGWCCSPPALGLAVGAWKTAHQQVVYVSTGRMMVSGKINLPEGATYTEEMNFFISTQRELMQDEAVRQRAENLGAHAIPEVAVTPRRPPPSRPLPQTSIFIPHGDRRRAASIRRNFSTP